jgi:hypothetical protein
MGSLEDSFEYFTPGSTPYGLSYGQWTVRWWQWLLSIPTEINPAADETGKNAGLNQTDPYVWFLAGTFGETAAYQIHTPAYRKCIVPAGKSLLFPVINYEMNSLEIPTLKTETELIKHVVEDMDDIIRLEASIDGHKIPVYRVRSDPPMFTIQLHENNPFRLPGGGTTQATSDGFWAFLKPLAVGEHEIYFEGSCSAGTRTVKARYQLAMSS